MSKDNENKLVPKLRFPEFKNKGDWNDTKLADFNELVSGDGNWILSKDITSNGEYRIVQLSSIGFGAFKEKDLKTISSETFYELNGTLIQKGDLLLNRMVDSNRINCCIFPHEGKYVTSVDVCWIRSNRFFDNYFLASLLCEKNNQNKLLSLSSGAGRVRISKRNLFEKFNFLLPPNFEEQQRIASCLSSLDEVITAESQKLEVLKDHKKGLLQNLFPQAGETVPKFRFKEFENSEEWVEEALKEITMFVNEKTSFESLSTNSYISTENLLPDYTGVTLASKLPASGNFTKYKIGDVLISNIRPYLKKVWLADKEGTCSNDVIVIRANSVVIASFLSFLLKNDAFINYIMKDAEGVKMPRGNKDSIKEYPIKFPKDKTEQQKIASCLSSLDDLIIAQNQKIETLQQHKKGLLQGLFPNVNTPNLGELESGSNSTPLKF